MPCVVVQGVCGFADDHKHSEWQSYAAMTMTSKPKRVLACYFRTNTTHAASAGSSDSSLSSTFVGAISNQGNRPWTMYPVEMEHPSRAEAASLWSITKNYVVVKTLDQPRANAGQADLQIEPTLA